MQPMQAAPAIRHSRNRLSHLVAAYVGKHIRKLVFSARAGEV